MNQFSCVKPQKSKHTEVKMSFVCMDFHIHLTDSRMSCLQEDVLSPKVFIEG